MRSTLGHRQVRSPGRRPLWLTAVAGLALTFTVTIAVALLPSPTIAGLPAKVGPSADPDFPTVNAVSGTPSDWISEVCAPAVQQVVSGAFRGFGQLSLLPSNGFRLPSAMFSATCRAKTQRTSDPVLLVARYPAEEPMQHDLARNMLRWYSFGAYQGSLVVIATRADESTPGSDGFAVSPVLEPLAGFGFNIYSGPGR